MSQQLSIITRISSPIKKSFSSVGSFDNDSVHSPKLVFICRNCSHIFHVQSNRSGSELYCSKDCETCFSLVSSKANGYNYQNNNNNTNSINTNKQEIYDFQLQIDNNRETKELSSNHNIYDDDDDGDDDHHHFRRINQKQHRSLDMRSDSIIIPKTNSSKDNNINNNNNNTKSCSKYDNITYISSKVRKNKTTAADRQAEAKDRSIWYTATPWQQFNGASNKSSRPQLHAYF